MTDADFMRKLRADAVRQLEMVETVTRILPPDLLVQTLERRMGAQVDDQAVRRRDREGAAGRNLN